MKFLWRFLVADAPSLSFKVLPGEYLKAVGFPRNTSGTPEVALVMLGWVLEGNLWPLEGTHAPAFWAATGFCTPRCSHSPQERYLGSENFVFMFSLCLPSLLNQEPDPPARHQKSGHFNNWVF